MDKRIIIKGVLLLQTGLHIGGDGSYSAIGMVDSRVVKDKVSKLPIIPGSSLKGKMRALLSKEKNGRYVTIAQDGEEILRLFGSSEKGKVAKARLQFCDCDYIKDESFVDVTTPYEIKYENTIDRIKVKSNPRQIERVVRGSKFNVTLIYCIENEDEKEQDIINIIQALKLLQLDYLGGGGSRGNGRILFTKFDVETVNEDLEIKQDKELTNQFGEVVEYGRLCCKI